MTKLFVVFAIFWATVAAIPVDNNVLGEPEIECGPTSLIVNFNTRNNFEGHVFVKGLYNQQECHTTDRGRPTAGIELPFSTCGVQRFRSANPRGIFISTTIIISFHPLFITKVDGAYRVQCFYMEADKTVDAELEVSMLTTATAEFQHPMPICRYEIFQDGPTGQPIRFAVVGEQVYHKWTCDSDAVDTFCMVVHSCFVDDGQGDRVTLLDENGCAIDRHLLDNLEYTANLMAGREAHVFKYADRPALFFNCQIRLTIKEPFEQCPIPNCPDLGRIGGGQSFGFPRRTPFNRRRPRSVKVPVLATVDVSSGEFEVLNDFNHNLAGLLPSQGQAGTLIASKNSSAFCFGPVGFSVLLTTYGMLIVTLFGTMCAYMYFRKRKEEAEYWWPYGFY